MNPWIHVMSEPEKSQQNIETAGKMASDGIYSQVSEVNLRILDAMPALLQHGFVLEDARPIAYGSRMTLRSGDAVTGANLFFSTRKGYSLVVDRNAPEPLIAQLKQIFSTETLDQKISGNEEERGFRAWIGSDEAGKGDFLGPLVVASFLADRGIVDDLWKTGVRDSKLISRDQCRRIARELFRRYKKRIDVVELVPVTYNRLYTQFKKQRKNLNDLLAWAHTRAVEILYQGTVQAVIIDRFARPSVVLRNFKINTRFILRTRAEDNIAVAAASILAKARFLYRLEKLSDMLEVKLVPGSGREAEEAARQTVEKHGPAVLQSIAKMHFKIANPLLNSISLPRMKAADSLQEEDNV